ncbi:dicarboxylate/amino acid:cation symporter [Paraflavitalea sp. CAU 1676]|uniref:dicarboxylate/amino acid:cation symporter n=1 Tax=Paraflavitalea sp. CAU 1676 TaxID=3032598 RepID=UPI0023DC8E79|nr:dicarboxylate/amino acid:cation symporter [Paraflavitalea sp. CAU 1676]MDF2187164.1 dicarboxylate/amino acid:cation symporter [Paraflavitalea sp. CAU 1676]
MIPKRSKKFYRSLYFQVIVAIVTGILLGHFYPSFAVQLKPLGDGFIRLVKMLIGPVIFCTIVSGMTGMDDMKRAGTVGVKALLYFEVLTTIALLIGLAAINILKPGVGMNIDVTKLDPSALKDVAVVPKAQTTTEFLLNIIPHTIFDAFTKGDLLQILLFSVLFGAAALKLGSRVHPVMTFIKGFSDILFGIIHVIMRVAPLGALGAMSFTIGKYGAGSLQQLAKLMGTFYLTCIIFIVVVLGSILYYMRFNIFKLLKYLKEELLIVLGTSSSESALPSLIEKLENAGCSKSVVGLVVPTGYSFNLDGTSIYLTMAAIFIAQATNTPMDLGQQLTLLLVLMITSKGAAGVTGSGFITLAATLPAAGNIPVAGLALILGIDRFMSEARALTNIIGNAVATIFVSKWEKELDMEKAKKVLQ